MSVLRLMFRKLAAFVWCQACFSSACSRISFSTASVLLFLGTLPNPDGDRSQSEKDCKRDAGYLHGHAPIVRPVALWGSQNNPAGRTWKRNTPQDPPLWPSELGPSTNAQFRSPQN